MPQEAPSVSSGQMFAPGNLVRVKADPSKTGAVIAVFTGGTETRYEVFHNERVASYYQSQLESTSISPAILPLDEFHARLTALQLLHPSISNLYSLHAARIETIPYQFRPVLKFIRSDQPRLLIADSVGVGKTIEAGLILRELQARQDLRRILIICPRPLVTEKKWQTEMKRFDERFEHLDGPTLRYCISETDLDGEWPVNYEKAIIPFSLLTEDILHGNNNSKGLIQLDPPPKFDLIIVDEAHHIRNTDTQRHQVIRFLCQNADAVVFLTATPIQLEDRDLFVLLNVLRPDIFVDEASFAAISEPNAAINEAAAFARKGGMGWDEKARTSLLQAGRTSWGQSVLLKDPRFHNAASALLNAKDEPSYRVQAIRNIEQLHTLSGIMNRTLRRDIGDFTERKPVAPTIEFTAEQQVLHDAVLRTQAEVYRHFHGDKAVNFLLTTIRRQAASCIHGLSPLLRDILTRRLTELDVDEMAGESEEALDTDSAVLRIKSMIEATLRLADALPCDPSADPKFLALKKILKDKTALPNHRVMIFSSFRHTLSYLENALRGASFRVGLIHGEVKDADRVSLRARFQKDRGDADAIDVLLFSEVGCEGLDYQFCDCIVNYDIPWNPMRIDQRIGRIDRWGQKSEAVAIYNLITPGTVDADIYERCLERIGVFKRALGANEAILGQITREITSVADNLALSPAERQSKLDQLAKNSIDRIKEQQDLEARQGELFGLRLPIDQFQKDVDDASSYWLSAASLERLVSRYLRDRAAHEEGPITGEGPQKNLRLSRLARESLLKDFCAIRRKSTAIATEWADWLKGSLPNLSVTFDSEHAKKDRTAVLITPVHPLAMQAASSLVSTNLNVAVVGLFVTSKTVPAGDYTFAIYQWQYHGIRSDVEFKTVTPDPNLARDFFRLIPEAQDMDVSIASITADMQTALEDQQYALWSHARALHIEETARLADFRRGSLDASHKARMAMLDYQLSRAENGRIQTMKIAEKANAQADYERRCREIDDARSSADIKTQVVGWGIIRVRD